VILHELNWDEKDITALTDFVGYHPYLIRLSMYCASQDNVSISNLLTNAQTNESIYRKYLERHFDYVNSDQVLLNLMAQVVKSSQGLEVTPNEMDLSGSTKLQELGLIEYLDNNLLPKNQLFKLYFTRKLCIKTI
jgi:AAA-like domain